MTRRKTWLNKNDAATTLPFHLNSSNSVQLATFKKLHINWKQNAINTVDRLGSWMILCCLSGILNKSGLFMTLQLNSSVA